MRQPRLARRLRRAFSRRPRSPRPADERFYRSLVESADEFATFTLGLDGRVTSWSAGAERMTGWTSEEMLGRGAEDVFAADELACRRPEKEMREAVEKGRSRSTCWHMRKDGTRFWASATLTPLRDEDDEIVGFARIVRDLTVRRRLEEEVQRGRRLVETVVESVPSLVSFVDRDQRYLVANRAYERWFGVQPGGAVGRTIREVVGEAAYAIVRPHVEAALSGRRVSFEARVPYAAGTRWIKADYIPSVEDGKVAGFVGIVTDIDAPVASRDRELRELGRMLESAHDAIVVRDLEDRITFWNRGAEELYGRSAGEAVGKVSHELLRTVFPVPLETIERAVLETGRWEGELVQFAADGRRIHANSRWMLRQDPEGRPNGMLEINRDVSHLRRALLDLSRANKELEDITFVSAHDLQEPMRQVGAFSELLARKLEGSLDVETAGYLACIRRAAERMKALVAAVLVYTRIGRDETEPAPVDLNELLDRVLRQLQPVLEAAEARVVHDRLPLLPARRPRMEQLFRELLMNSLAFRGSEAPRVEISARAVPDGFVLTVADNGRGIPDEHLKRVFEPFKRLQSAGRGAGGAGVGLAIVRRIAELHGGRAWAEGGRAKGAAISVFLPAQRV